MKILIGILLVISINGLSIFDKNLIKNLGNHTIKNVLNNLKLCGLTYNTIMICDKTGCKMNGTITFNGIRYNAQST
jgi:hypothetical protein